MTKFSDILNIPLGWLINICYSLIPNYIVALLLFAVIIKVILLPLGILQHKNSLKQARLKPRETAIVKKYAGRNDRVTQQKKQEEIQKLYQSENYNQFAGCLPMILQLFIVICIYNVVRNPLTYISRTDITAVKQALYDLIQSGVLNVSNVSQDFITLASKCGGDMAKFNISELQLIDFLKNNASLHPAFNIAIPNFGIFGLDFSATPMEGHVVLLLVPVLNFFATFFSSKLIKKLSYQSPQAQSADTKASMGFLEITMPLLSTWFAATWPAMIGVYWIYQSLLGILQQFLLVKVKPYPVFTDADYKEAERIMSGKSRKPRKKEKDPDRPMVRSLHHIDDDDYNERLEKNGEKKTEVGTKSDLLPPVPMKEYKDKKNK